MSIRINLEIGHEASLRTKRTPEGFTHDWEVFVRGCDRADIHNYVEKVVFNLHETFPRPKRIIKEPPYSVKESGYAGFTFPIDIYLRNRDEPKVITFDYDLQLQPSGPSISNVQKEKYVFNSVPDDFKHKLLKGGGIFVSLSTQDNLTDSRPSEDKNQLYNKPNFGGSSSDNSKKHKGGAKGPQSQMPNEPKPTSDFVDLFGDYIYKANQTSTGGDTNKGEKSDRAEGRSYKDKISEKDKSKSKQSPNITKDRDKDKSSKQDKPIIAEPSERTKKDDKRNKDRTREKQRDRSKDEKISNTSNSNSRRDKSPRPKSPSPLIKRSLSPKRRTATPSPSPKRPPSPSPSPVQQKQHKSDKRSYENSKEKEKDKDRPKEDRKRDKKDKRDKEHKENKHKEHRSKDIQVPKKERDVPKVIEQQPIIPPATSKLDKKDKSTRDKEKDKEKEVPKELERVQQVQTSPTNVEKPEKARDLSTSSSKIQQQSQVLEQPEKPPKHKHKKKDKDKKQKDKNSNSSTKPEKEDKKDKEGNKESRKDKKEKLNKLSIDQFIAEPKSNSFTKSPKEELPKGRSKSIIDDDSSNSSLEDLNDDRFGRDKSVEKVIEIPKLSLEKSIPSESKKPPPPQIKHPTQSETLIPSRNKDKLPKPRKEKRQQQSVTEQNDDDNLDGGSSKKKKKRKATELAKVNHKSEHLMDSEVDIIKSNVIADVNEPPEKIPREEFVKETKERDVKETKERDVKETKERDVKETKETPSSNGKTVNSKKDSKDISKEILKDVKEDVTDDAEDYLKILRELQTKIMSLQDNIELQRVVQLIAETGRYEVSDRTFDFDLCLLDRSTVRQLQEFFANLAM